MAIDRQRLYHKRDRLRQLRAFSHAARLGSAARAAEHLSISQPAVSLHVRELEHELEAVLFERRGPNISLTAAGERLYAIVRPLVESMESLAESFVDGLDDSVTGLVHVAAGPSASAYVLPPYLLRYRAAFPEVRLRVTTALVGDALKLLAAGEVDLVMGAAEPVDGEYVFRRSFVYHHVLIVPEGHPLCGRDEVAIEEAARHPAIVPPPETYERQPESSVARRFVAQAPAVLTTSGWGVVKQYVEAGLGIAVVPNMCLGERDRLRVVPLREERVGLEYGVYTRRGVAPAPPAARFLEMVAPDSSHGA